MTRGLAGVVVADTALSRVDGERGELVLRGMRVQDAARLGFEALVSHLWGEPVELGAARVQAADLLRRHSWVGGRVATPRVAMDALRAAIGALPEVDDCVLVAAVGVTLAAWVRREDLVPDPALGHAADLLRMIRGESASEAEVEALDAYLCTVVDHGLNASTFAARVVASTGSDHVSAVVAGLGALKGPLHGGAPGPVLDMLDAIGDADRAEPWIRAELAAGRRIMGMGHRVYRVRDPRAAALEGALGRLGADQGRLELARAVERTAERILEAHRPGRKLRANVEFYTATLLEALGVPRAAFTATFAASRVAGWIGHAREQEATGTLIRPRAAYVGPEVAAG